MFQPYYYSHHKLLLFLQDIAELIVELPPDTLDVGISIKLSYKI